LHERITLAIALYNFGRYETALNRLKSCLSHESVRPLTYRLQGNCYRQMGKLGKARERYRLAEEHIGRSATLELDRGALSLRLGDLDKATEYFNRAAERKPAAANFWLSRISYLLNDFEAARRYCHAALAADPNYAPALLFAPQLYGTTEMEGGFDTHRIVFPHSDSEELRQALLKCHGYLLRVLAANPADPRALICAAQILFQLGDERRARDFALEALRVAGRASYIIKWTALLAGPHPEVAFELLSEALELSPTSSETLVYLALFSSDADEHRSILSDLELNNPLLAHPVVDMAKLCRKCRASDKNGSLWWNMANCPKGNAKWSPPKDVRSVFHRFWRLERQPSQTASSQQSSNSDCTQEPL